ncbi:MAG: PilZ domain-containing protein [Myxococcaceae bacterium]
MTQNEKRATPRIPVTLTGHCRIGHRFVREPIADLSLGGLYLRTRESVTAGLPVRVALALPWNDGPRYCTLVGSVARVERDPRGVLRGIGVCFTRDEIAGADRDTLQSFLSSQCR